MELEHSHLKWLVGNVIVKFHPDAEFASDTITHQAYNQHIYTDIDEFNIPPAYLVLVH